MDSCSTIDWNGFLDVSLRACLCNVSPVTDAETKGGDEAQVWLSSVKGPGVELDGRGSNAFCRAVDIFSSILESYSIMHNASGYEDVGFNSSIVHFTFSTTLVSAFCFLNSLSCIFLKSGIRDNDFTTLLFLLSLRNWFALVLASIATRSGLTLGASLGRVVF